MDKKSKLFFPLLNSIILELGILFILVTLAIFPILAYGDEEKERLEYKFAKDNLKRLEEQALNTYASIIQKGGIYKNHANLDVGIFYYEKGAFDKSLEYLNRIYRGIDDEDICTGANLYRGKIYSSYEYPQRNLNEAYASFIYIIDVYPQNINVKNAVLELANLYFVENNFPKAIKTYCDLIFEYPDCPIISRALLGIGLSYIKLDKVNSSLAWFKKLIDEYPESEDSILAKKYTSQILKVNVTPRGERELYKLDSSFNPDFKSLDARSLEIINEFEGNKIITANNNKIFKIDTINSKINEELLKGVIGYLSDLQNKYFPLMKTGFFVEDKEVPLSVAQHKGDGLKTLRNILCGDVDSKGNYYIIDDVVPGLHIFSQNMDFKKTIETSLDGKIKSISIDPLDKIYLQASSKDLLLILNEVGEEIETINLKERFDIASPVKLKIDWIGNKFIFDKKSDIIFILNQGNSLLHKFLLVRKGDEFLKNPKDFCIDEVSNLYVLDSSKNTVVKFK
ncbi:hypothetical protein KKB18_12800 [bacterium]|nr:hypothetical protein [bacterium]